MLHRENLHKYQIYSVEHIKFHKECALLLEMGLGKTISTLTAIVDLIEQGEVKKVLIIAPKRVAQTVWSSEIENWYHTRHLGYSIILGTAKQREKACVAEADIYIINRENLDWLTKTQKWKWDMVVIDELSSFKSATSQRSRALFRMRPHFNRIVGLTGTPQPNGIEDLFGEFKVIDGGKRLGKTLSGFRAEYMQPAWTQNGIVYKWRPRLGAEETVHKKISDISVSMKAVDHLKMPELVDTNFIVELDAKQRKLYEELKEEFYTEVGEDIVVAKTAATLAGKLLQLATGRVYDEDKNVVDIHEAKLDALEEIAEQTSDNIMVCYWFKHSLPALKKRFPKGRELLTEQDIRDWNEGRIKMLFVHPASAGHGLNLQRGGHTMVWYTVPWSLELYQQATARIYRQGQTSKTVNLIHILTKNTFDQKVMAAIKNKDTSQESLMRAVKWK
jgi:SNF2 family DNA or RNA helicase